MWYFITLKQTRAAMMNDYVVYVKEPCYVFDDMQQIWRALSASVTPDDCIFVFVQGLAIAQCDKARRPSGSQ